MSCLNTRYQMHKAVKQELWSKVFTAIQKKGNENKDNLQKD